MAVIGLDCATPRLLFDEFRADMPRLAAHLDRSAWGRLQSSVPPITVPAWSCMFSGRTPGELGVYGFRNRVDHSYDEMRVATSRHIRVPRVWDQLSAEGRPSVLLGVPGTYPVPRGIRGTVVSDLLTPRGARGWAQPPEVAQEICGLAGPYAFDVADFRTDDKERLAAQIFDLTEQRFSVARHLATTRPWDLFAMVDMGPDRLHHGFWATFDPQHPRHDPSGPFRTLVRDYYRMLDAQLGRLFEVFDDDVAVLIASDHGAQPMVGGFRINQWLIDEGYLTLADAHDKPRHLTAEVVDWSRTAAWADGGYYARIFLNVAGREPGGIVTAAEYESVRSGVVSRLEAVLGPDGRPLGNRAFRPEDIYPDVRGVAPDLIAYLGDLRWRSVASVGGAGKWFTTDNDTGPDDVNHAEHGVFALSGGTLGVGRRPDLSLYEISPMLRRLLGVG